jgi:hypothetical protein
MSTRSRKIMFVESRARPLRRTDILIAVSRLSGQCGTLNITQSYKSPWPVMGIALVIFFTMLCNPWFYSDTNWYRSSAMDPSWEATRSTFYMFRTRRITDLKRECDRDLRIIWSHFFNVPLNIFLYISGPPKWSLCLRVLWLKVVEAYIFSLLFLF